MLKSVLILMIVAASVAILPASQSVDEASAGRTIANKWQDAIVTMRLVINTRVVVGGREMQKTESRSETAATIIDPSGLAVLSLSATNPGDTMNRIMPRMGGSDGPDVKMETTPTDVKMRLSDGQEVAAKIVLQDNDLDIAFARPVAKLPKPVTPLDLVNEARPKVLESIVVLSRLGKVAGWAPAASLDRIRAIIDRPRTFYVPASASSLGETGTPAFSMDGRVIGIVLLRIVSSDGSGALGLAGGLSSLPMLPVILPASDIRELAKQVPAK